MRKNSYLKNILTKELLEKEFAELKSSKAIGRKLGVSGDTVSRYMEEFGLISNKKVSYNCNHNAFSIDSEISFYLAGFIAADGCIKSKKGTTSKSLYIGLSNKDRKHLEKIRDALGAEHPIGDYEVKNSKRNANWDDTICSSINITSSQIYQDLQRFNVTERKTHTLTFPDWMKDHPLRHHFIRGYIDGDGCFSSAVGKGRKVRQVFFSVRGTTAFLTSLRSTLEADLSLEERTKDIRFNNGIGVLEYGGNRICKSIAEYLYKDATIYLERKKNSAFAFEEWDTKEFFTDKGITKEMLEKVYFQTKSISKTSSELGISRGTIYNHLLKNNIKISRSALDKREELLSLCTPDALRESYKVHGKISKVAKQFNISQTTATRYLRSAGII
jgi:DNA-binding CsgD family transcriptional regulator